MVCHSLRLPSLVESWYSFASRHHELKPPPTTRRHADSTRRTSLSIVIARKQRQRAKWPWFLSWYILWLIVQTDCWAGTSATGLNKQFYGRGPFCGFCRAVLPLAWCPWHGDFCDRSLMPVPASLVVLSVRRRDLQSCSYRRAAAVVLNLRSLSRSRGGDTAPRQCRGSSWRTAAGLHRFLLKSTPVKARQMTTKLKQIHQHRDENRECCILIFKPKCRVRGPWLFNTTILSACNLYWYVSRLIAYDIIQYRRWRRIFVLNYLSLLIAWFPFSNIQSISDNPLVHLTVLW